jgi:Sec-independent protein translocase protein TatA
MEKSTFLEMGNFVRILRKNLNDETEDLDLEQKVKTLFDEDIHTTKRFRSL